MFKLLAQRLLLLSLVLLGAFVAPVTVEAASSQPNVLIIYADDLGYGDLSCYGATKLNTPHVDALARDGLLFTNGRSTAATCTPSRYSIMTGQYAWRKKGTGILPGDAGLIIPTDRPTLGKVFQKNGYSTAYVGKWHLGLGPQGGPDWNGVIEPSVNDTGFDYSFIFPATADRVPTVYVRNNRVVGLDPADPIEVNYKSKIGTEPTGKENPELLKMKSSPGQGHDDTIVNGIGRIGFMKGGTRARWVDESVTGDFTDEAELFLEANREKPFFLFFSMSEPHVPRMPNTRFKGSSGLGFRGDSILQLDFTVGRLKAKLDDLGLTTNTLIVLSSDNVPVLDDGYVDGAVTERNGHEQNGHLRGGKYSIFEAGTRVPFIVHWPAMVKPGKSDALVSQMDFMATFAKMLGHDLSDNEAADSKPVLDALLGKSETGRKSMVIQAGAAVALIKGNWKYIPPYDGPQLFKLTNIESGYSSEPQLYDLSADIGEKTNLALKHPQVVEDLAAELAEISGSGNSTEQ